MTESTEQALVGAYQQYVERIRERKPSLSNLCQFLREPSSAHMPCRATSLSFFEGKSFPESLALDFDALRTLLLVNEDDTDGSVVCRESKDRVQLQGRIILVEDLDKKTIEFLGAQLDIDPLFFAGHIHLPWKGVQAQVPEQCMLPSQIERQPYMNIHYHRAVQLLGSSPPVDILRRRMNVDRKVVITSPSKDQNVGIAQHCASILLCQRNMHWICLVLVDPPIGTEYLYTTETDECRSFSAACSFFLGGYEDFLDSPSLTQQDSKKVNFGYRGSLLDDLLLYWTLRVPESFDPRKPSLHSLAYFPLGVIAAEWMKYVGIMYRAVKQFEYSTSFTNIQGQLDKLDSDMRALQRWRRRSMSSQQKVHAVIHRLKCNKQGQALSNNSASLIEDFEYIAASMEGFGRRLESMLPVVASLVQTIDSRRSFKETANVSRLTAMALVFVPLTYVSSLFSMSDRLGPGGGLFWTYFAVAIPLTIIVIVIAKPPTSLLRIFANLIRGPWRSMHQITDTDVGHLNV